jgi:peptidoglycan/xylan/chitin deacetylase (PgdA/CDA1 family)
MPPAPARAKLTQPLRRLLGELTLALAAARRYRPPGIPILAYHSIADTPGCDIETVTADALARQLEWLSAHGIQAVSVSQMLSQVAISPPARPLVCLTFDDGYADNRENALPILRRLGVSATFYVSTAYLGETSSWNPSDYIGPRPMMTAEDLRALNAAGHEIGSHGHLHVDLTTLAEATVTEQLRLSGQILERTLGHPVFGFAPPHGRTSATVTRAARAAGFQHLVRGGRFLPNRIGESPFQLHRITIARNDSLREFVKKVSGCYGFLAFWDE